MTCDHTELHTDVSVQRTLVDGRAERVVTFSITCTGCGEKMQFHGGLEALSMALYEPNTDWQPVPRDMSPLRNFPTTPPPE